MSNSFLTVIYVLIFDRYDRCIKKFIVAKKGSVTVDPFTITVAYVIRLLVRA